MIIFVNPNPKTNKPEVKKPTEPISKYRIPKINPASIENNKTNRKTKKQ